MTPFDRATDDLDPLLRQMFQDFTAPAGPSNLAHRARRLAGDRARAELAAMARLRGWAACLTAIAMLSMAGYVVHVARANVDLSGWLAWTGSMSQILNTHLSAATEAVLITVMTAVAAIVGVVLISPSAGHD